MKHWKTSTKLKFLSVFLIFGLLLYFYTGENGFMSTNNSLVKRVLRKNELENGRFGEVLKYGYHNLIIFEPGMSKAEMRDYVDYVDYNKYKTSEDPKKVNMLFTYAHRASGYIYGNPEKLGFRLNLEPGHYGRASIENYYFIMDEVEGKNGKSYKEYTLYPTYEEYEEVLKKSL